MQKGPRSKKAQEVLFVLDKGRKRAAFAAFFAHLKVHDLLLAQLPEGDAPGHEDGGGLRHPEDLPAQVLEEGRQLGLARRLAPARPTG